MLWVDKKYLRLIASRFRNSKWKNEDLLNHACPYCGDSEKNPHKARGYHFVYKETFIFKCHNCGESKPFAKFLRELKISYNLGKIKLIWAFNFTGNPNSFDVI